MGKKRLGYKETFADYFARFLVCSVIGAILAFGLLTRYHVYSKPMLISVVVASGLAGAFLWGSFWRFIEGLAK